MSKHFVHLLPTGLQIAASVTRVLAFGWAVVQIGMLPGQEQILQLVGYLPFFAIFDVVLQSWSRSAQIRRARWTLEIGKWRIALVTGALLCLCMTATLALRMEMFPAAFLIVNLCCLFGSFALVWERWLASRCRAMSAAVIEIVLLVFAIVGYSQGWWPEAVLLLCFVGYLIARLLSLLLPGDAVIANALPESGGSTRHYLGYALGQQLLGATAASVPVIFSGLTGTTAGLPLALAQFRAMHSFAAMASFVINAIGGRLFFGEAKDEMAIIEVVAERLRRWRLLLDGTCLLLIISLSAFWTPHAFVVLLPFIIMLAANNFRSSFAINRGRPRDCFLLQGSVFLGSVVAIFCMYERLGPMLLAVFVYCVYALISECYVADGGILARHQSNSHLGT